MESNHPVANALLNELQKAWPRALAYDELAPRLAETGFVLDAAGAALLMKLAISKMIELRMWRAPVAAAISERPRASAYSRCEGKTGQRATTLLHLTIKLDDAHLKKFLQLLDGTRTRNELLDAMKVAFPEMPVKELEEGIDLSLRNLYLAGVLEA